MNPIATGNLHTLEEPTAHVMQTMFQTLRYLHRHASSLNFPNTITLDACDIINWYSSALSSDIDSNASIRHLTINVLRPANSCLYRHSEQSRNIG